MYVVEVVPDVSHVARLVFVQARIANTILSSVDSRELEYATLLEPQLTYGYVRCV